MRTHGKRSAQEPTINIHVDGSVLRVGSLAGTGVAVAITAFVSRQIGQRWEVTWNTKLMPTRNTKREVKKR